MIKIRQFSDCSLLKILVDEPGIILTEVAIQKIVIEITYLLAARNT